MELTTEFEAKFLDVGDIDHIRKNLKKVGALLEYPELILKYIIFNKYDNEKMKVDYIRIRGEGDIITMSAKIHAKKDGNLSDQKEEMVTVSNFEDAIKILSLAGLTQTSYQEKKRELWMLDEVEICIDTWPEGTPYIEIEGKTEEQVKSTAEKLNLDWDKKYIISIVDILMEKHGWSQEKTFKHLSLLRF